MNMPSQIAIDGPAASGKSTVGKKLAEKLNYLFFDTGLMYRVATFAVLQRNQPVTDEKEVAEIIRNLDIQLRNDPATGETQVLIDNEDISQSLHSPGVDEYVSTIAAYPEVRIILTGQQRKIGLAGNIVIVGRDIGTVVLPEAGLKIFLLASAQNRAERRFLENKKKGINSTYEEILENILQRDMVDSTRSVAPLMAAEDAIKIDTDDLSSDQVVAKILQTIDN